MVKQLDELDKKLLTLAQREFPLDSRPYQRLGEELGLSGQEVIERIKELKEAGYIRRLGGIFSSKKLGYVSTLAAAKVAEEQFYQVVEEVNQYQGVTHNYRRNHDFNLWFTLIAPDQASLEEQLAEIEVLVGVKVLHNLPAERFYKLGVKLNLEKEG
ncbi:AsnC family transcriptional regulator [Natroniella acetigena]|uniref:siroheme decarboxylase subunit alpha n=1 Tax=Natroniella acetigena TaxID=52004 RepID=UPI00200AE333|nr:AsnC family transcriptional regulator [Natroniella acetigena]MCK8826139.1 AsnC family transcriptional regulator [Natroniella acetigena]